MIRKICKKGFWQFSILLIAASLLYLLAGCALAGSVVDYGNFETNLTDIRLEKSKLVRVYCGGSRRSIPLKIINSIIINPAISITVDQELYFGAEIILKDGSTIQSSEKDQSVRTQAFVCVHHRVLGKRNGEVYKAGFEHIRRLSIY